MIDAAGALSSSTNILLIYGPVTEDQTKIVMVILYFSELLQNGYGTGL